MIGTFRVIPGELVIAGYEPERQRDLRTSAAAGVDGA